MADSIDIYIFYINRYEWESRTISWAISDVPSSLLLILWTSLPWFTLTFQRHILVRWGGDCKLPKNMNAAILQNEWTGRETVWNKDSRMFTDPISPWSHTCIFKAPPSAQIYPLPLQTKLLLCCTIVFFFLSQLSGQPGFSGALLQISTPAKTHTTAHFPPAKNSPMRGDTHSSKHSERNTVYELEILTMNATLAANGLSTACEPRQRRRPRRVKKKQDCHDENRSVTPQTDHRKTTAPFPLWALEGTVPPIGQKRHKRFIVKNFGTFVS